MIRRRGLRLPESGMAEFTRSIISEDAFQTADCVLDRLREGDEAAFAQMFHLYRDMVYTLAFKLLDDKADSMDVTQEVFLTLFRKIGSFRGECSLKTWLYRVAVNEAASRNRWWNRRRRDRTVSLDLPVRPGGERSPEVTGDGPSPVRECFSAELRQALNAGLRKLPFDQRVAVVLRDVEGLGYEEISSVTGANPGTVKSRIARGRESLRALLDGFRGGERL